MKKNFTLVPNKLCRAANISPAAKAVFLLLASYNPSFPSYAHIKTITGLSSKTISKAIKQLKEARMITSTRGNQRNGPNKYQILDESLWPVLSPGKKPVLSPGKTNKTKENKNKISMYETQEVTNSEGVSSQQTADGSPVTPPIIEPAENSVPTEDYSTSLDQLIATGQFEMETKEQTDIRKLAELELAANNPIFIEVYGSPEAARNALKHDYLVAS